MRIPAGRNKGLVQIHLCLCQCRFGACLFRRQERRNPRDRGLLGCHCDVDSGLTLIHQHLQLFDVALRHDPGIATLQFALHIQLVPGLLMRALRFLDLGFRLCDVCFSRQHRGIDFGDLALGRFERRLLFRAIEPEDYVALGDRRTELDVDFRHTS